MSRIWNRKAIFVDTSAIIANISKKEDKHEDAVNAFQLLRQGGYHLFISNYIVDEVYAGILNASKIQDKSQRIQLAFRILEELHNKKNFSVLFVKENIEEEARRELLNFSDKLWSITDMTSFLFMKKGEIPYFLSFDSDFNQASYHFGFLDIRPYLSSR
ncbi:MAG TPA: PIN domain-containing protein [Ktedonobacteraceae bacterium]|nr:PIN domain-containing protein [Ktedonobacteraceae bacterium]